MPEWIYNPSLKKEDISMSDSKKVQITTDETFQEVLSANKLALVDFWAEWCGPCKLLGPTIEKLANEYDGKVLFYKMDVDSNPSTPSKFNVRGIPTVIFIKDGKLVHQIVGNQPIGHFQDEIKKHIT